MLTGSTVVLTGVGGEGQLGEAVARTFAETGASLVLVDRTLAKVEARAHEFVAAGHVAHGYACDLTDATAVDSLAREIAVNHGPAVRALVHMAGGFAMSGPVAESSPDVWSRQISINLTTAFLASRAFLPLVRAARGSVVFVASQAAAPGGLSPNMSAYAVAKTGVVVLMQSIALEERQNGVRANAVAPAAIRTAANVQAMGSGSHFVEREQVAATIAFLCSDAAAAITGQLVSLT